MDGKKKLIAVNSSCTIHHCLISDIISNFFFIYINV